MKVIARGYATHDPEDQHILAQLVITPSAAEHHEGLQPGLWWSFEYVPSWWDRLVARIPAAPTRRSRIVGAGIMVFLLVVVMAVAGAIEGKADTGSLYARQVAVWESLTPLDRAYYCEMPRHDAVLVWAAGIDESQDWKVLEARKVAVSRRVLKRGCAA